MLRHTDRHSLSLTERPSAVPKWQFNFIHDDLMRCIECASLCWQFQFFFHLLSCMWFCLFSDDKRTKQIRSVHWSLSQMVCGKRERRIKKNTVTLHFNAILTGFSVCVVVSSVVWLTRDSYLFANAFNFTDNHLFLCHCAIRHHLLIVGNGNYGWECIESEMISTPIAAGTRGNGFRLEFNKNIHLDERSHFFRVVPRNTVSLSIPSARPLHSFRFNAFASS